MLQDITNFIFYLIAFKKLNSKLLNFQWNFNKYLLNKQIKFIQQEN